MFYLGRYFIIAKAYSYQRKSKKREKYHICHVTTAFVNIDVAVK